MKFGVDVPVTYEEAMEIDKRNGNSLGADSIKKEMEYCIRFPQ
jgi:hypothetical protein